MLIPCMIPSELPSPLSYAKSCIPFMPVSYIRLFFDCVSSLSPHNLHLSAYYQFYFDYSLYKFSLQYKLVIFTKVTLLVRREIRRLYPLLRGARGVMVIVVGNGHGDTSSNSGRD